MKQRKCPHCGEYVQRNSLTCPKCFREVPRESPAERPEHTDDDRKRGFGNVSAAAVFLSVFPAFVGLLGLGLIYSDSKNRMGYWFLLAGLMLFVPFVILFFTMVDSDFFQAVLMLVALVILLLIYISAAVAAFIETVFGSVIKFLRF